MSQDTIKSDGGPSSYYDMPSAARTLNDVIEYLAYNRWLGDSAHLKDVFKACWRWGSKEGTTKVYDCKKIIYSAARLIKYYAGVTELRRTLIAMLNDPQFQEEIEPNE